MTSVIGFFQHGDALVTCRISTKQWPIDASHRLSLVSPYNTLDAMDFRTTSLGLRCMHRTSLTWSRAPKHNPDHLFYQLQRKIFKGINTSSELHEMATDLLVLQVSTVWKFSQKGQQLTLNMEDKSGHVAPKCENRRWPYRSIPRRRTGQLITSRRVGPVSNLRTFFRPILTLHLTTV